MKIYVHASGWGKSDILADYVGTDTWVCLGINRPDLPKKCWFQLISDEGDYYNTYARVSLNENTQETEYQLPKSDIWKIINDCPSDWLTNNIKAAKEIPIGTKVYIKSPNSWYNGEWGIVKYFDGDDYHVAIANGDDCPIFERRELRVVKV